MNEPYLWGISRRELEVFTLYIQGNVGKVIGTRLGISEQTVKNHLASVYAKLDVDNGRAAAWKLGWVKPTPVNRIRAGGVG